MASMGAAMASAILCIHRNRNTVRHLLAAHCSSLGATLRLMMVGCVLVGSTYGCGRMHGKHVEAAVASAIAKWILIRAQRAFDKNGVLTRAARL